MIIRRRHTKNFTIIGNELFTDKRLALDEVGLLGYLLSQANDWEVRRPALRKRWNVGRDGMKRMIDNLLRTGWCQAEKTRLSNGTFSIIYTVCDEPGPTLSDDDVRAALSVVSTEVGNDEPSESDGLESTGPPTPQPYVVNRLAVGRDWEESLNKDSKNTESTKAAVAVWSEVRKAWPASDILSPMACEKLFAALSQADRQQAFEAIGPYLANCRTKNRKLCDLSTYLKERRFVGKLAIPVAAFLVKPGTAQAARWLEYLKAAGKPHGFMEQQLAHGHAVTMLTEWPPALPPKQQSTGPPLPISNLMKPGEENDFKYG